LRLILERIGFLDPVYYGIYHDIEYHGIDKDNNENIVENKNIAAKKNVFVHGTHDEKENNEQRKKKKGFV